MNDTNDSAAAGSEADAAALEQQLQTMIAERDEFQDKFARARADLENYRKRIQREMEEDRKYAALPLLKGMLPALDGLDRALNSAKQSKNVDELITGIEMVVKQFEAALKAVGVQPVQATGEPFDPHVHEAIQQLPSAEYPPLTVIDDVERGYLLHDRVVRPSKVIVSSAPQ